MPTNCPVGRRAPTPKNRVERAFYSDPPPRPNRRPSTGGRPPRHGQRHQCSKDESWPSPDDELVAHDLRYGAVSVSAWYGLHPRLIGRGRWAKDGHPPIVKVSVIRIDVEHLPKPAGRVKKTLWCVWSGPDVPDLDLCWRAYLRRFDIEHYAASSILRREPSGSWSRW
ncbi:MAG TPA: hypothetical protein VMU99_11180 [Acidimicrobiales bacterium]|nr:hypothetical protein [Acidimicrobiales bacterium]